jgi:hypothetical protein
MRGTTRYVLEDNKVGKLGDSGYMNLGYLRFVNDFDVGP